MGGYAVTAVLAEEQENIFASVCVSAFNSPFDTIYYQLQESVGFYANFEYPFAVLYNKAIFGNDANVAAVDGINAVGIPVLVVYATEDDVIPYNQIGIYAYKDNITNPNVVFWGCDEKYRNFHDTIQLSSESAKYMFETRSELENLHAQYENSIPDNVLVDFLDKVDKSKLNILDVDYMNTVNNFFVRSIPAGSKEAA
jgi:hypothetical protein